MPSVHTPPPLGQSTRTYARLSFRCDKKQIHDIQSAQGIEEEAREDVGEKGAQGHQNAGHRVG